MKRTKTHPIAQRWSSGGPYVGNQRPAIRVTVEVDWVLREQTGAFFPRGPVRWFQRADNSQVEAELPNVLNFNLSESIDEDAATCTLKLANQKMDVLGASGSKQEIGNPGYFSWSRGDSTIGQVRWGHTQNEWHNILTPNTLLRVYEGFGGHDKTIPQALTDGDVLLTGVFLIDEVTVRTGASIDIRCRNMAKLLLDQSIFPPLIPEYDINGCDIWPLQYRRWYNQLGTQNRAIRYGDYVGAGRKIVGFEFSPDTDPCGIGEGYWLVGDDGGVFTYGYQQFYGSMGGIPINLPLIGIARAGTGRGYWLGAQDGGVFTFGDAGFHGSLPSIDIAASDVVAIETSHTKEGYYLLRADGSVYAFGDAVYHGGGGVSGTAVSMAVRPGGYWILTNTGNVYSFGSATYHGGVSSTTDAVAIETSAGGDGYLIARAEGTVYAFGDAPYYGSPYESGIVLNDPITDIIVHPNGQGYWLAADDGGVFTFGDPIAVRFYGSLPGPWVNLGAVEGNYTDYADIVKDLLLWSGFWLNDGGVAPNVYGNIESTGTYSPEPLKPEFFDKQPVMDVINKLKEIVGYITWVDGEGGFHFESPNWWQPGNFLLNGAHIAEIPQIDEIINMTGYGVQFNDRNLRSEIVISNYMPSSNLDGTVTTRYKPSGLRYLKNIVRPMYWVNQIFTDARTQQTMAELIDLHMWFQNRLGSVDAVANPLIDPNDQVRLYERETAETYVHYVRSVERSFDVKSGQYTMSLVTNWLGDDNSTDLGPGAGGGAGGIGTGESWAVVWPTAYMQTRQESVALTDEIRFRLEVSPLEPVGITDSVVVVTSSARTITDAEGILDSRTTARTEAASAGTDALGLTDSVAVGVTVVIASTVTDSLGSVDSVAHETTVVIAETITDPVGSSDSSTLVAAQSRSHADSSGLLDSVSQVGTLNDSMTSAAGITDAVTVVLSVPAEPATATVTTGSFHGYGSRPYGA